MRVLGVIPARGGSKGVPRKNVASVAGKPMLQWTAEAALGARSLTRVIVSTEDAEIATIARACGVEVPFERPMDLAADDTPSLDVVQHAVRTLEASGDTFDAVCLLQPTNPARGSDVIDACIDLFETSGADSVVTVLSVPADHNPHWTYLRRPDGSLQLATGGLEPIPRRQLLPEAFHREGSVYVVRRNVLMDRGSLYGDKVVGYAVDPALSVNVDGPEDLIRASQLLDARESG